VFGWSFQQWADNPYWLISTGEGPGIDGGLTPRRGPEPAVDNPVSAFVIVVQVEDLDATAKAIEAAGGSVVVEKRAVPGVGWTAYCKDTEVNVFGLMQDDPSAA
jgi:uncharacterized protein